MKEIQTKLFRLGGVLQVGFQNLDKEDIQSFRSLRGFRFCGGLKIWHITFRTGVFEYLNSFFRGRYKFIEDKTNKRDIPDIEIEASFNIILTQKIFI